MFKQKNEQVPSEKELLIVLCNIDMVTFFNDNERENQKRL